MNALDRLVITCLNSLSQRSDVLDRTVVFLSNCDLAKGAVVMSFVWWAWFAATKNPQEARRKLCAAIFGSLAALFIARVLAYVAPFRLRPLLNPELHFRAPTTLPDQSNWTHWSSFPSDHAALFCALAFGVWGVSRRAGYLLFAYIGLFIAVPRMYIGIHYPTDVFAGVALGIGIVSLSNIQLVRRAWVPAFDWVMSKTPALAYGVLFFLSYQIASLFYDVRGLMSLIGYNT